ncbi:unnamed protein product [Clonostachys rosea f. rosea IK726]|uniref:Uncharacterized protein n=1 Tax=Clonostachys rosea f. rosea IK726 TaxID=1349383 RepID=A0ACA9U940_BIOOC|nr:unnamed protein product [Clonostachys rosea f. rosea IK726]
MTPVADILPDYASTGFTSRSSRWKPRLVPFLTTVVSVVEGCLRQDIESGRPDREDLADIIAVARHPITILLHLNIREYLYAQLLANVHLKLATFFCYDGPTTINDILDS